MYCIVYILHSIWIYIYIFLQYNITSIITGVNIFIFIIIFVNNNIIGISKTFQKSYETVKQ